MISISARPSSIRVRSGSASWCESLLYDIGPVGQATFDFFCACSTLIAIMFSFEFCGRGKELCVRYTCGIRSNTWLGPGVDINLSLSEVFECVEFLAEIVACERGVEEPKEIMH